MVIESKVAEINGHVSKHMGHKRVASLAEPLLRERMLAEFVGTFFLVLTVCVGVAGGGPMAPVAIGLALGVQIFTFGTVSGAFFNPAVAFGVYMSGRGKISLRDAVIYSVVECLGGIFGACTSYVVTDSTFAFQHQDWGTSLMLETLFTAMLVGTVLATGTSNDAPNNYFGFAIGLSVTAGALASGGFDQGSFNPAVTLGANFANAWNAAPVTGPTAGAWLLFMCAPLLGGALAAAIFAGTRGNEFRGYAVVEQEADADVPGPVDV